MASGEKHVDKILKGTKPADLPVERPTKFGFVHQPQGCESVGAHDSAVASDKRRQGDRVTTRRKFLIAGGAGLYVLAAPIPLFAQQQTKVWRIGILLPGSRPTVGDPYYFDTFVNALRDLGYIDGKNIVIEWRFADNKYERFPELASQLVNLKIDLIVTHGTAGTRAAQQATSKIPIVTASFADPVQGGFVASLARPASNITGLSNMNEDLSAKRLDLLISAVPKVRRIAWLVNPGIPTVNSRLPALQTAARKASKTIVFVEASEVGHLVEAFALMAREGVGALIVWDDAFMNSHGSRIAQMAERQKLPAIFATRTSVSAGGLMSYGIDYEYQYRRAATYVDRVLRGAKPGDLPIEQPTKFELTINMKTAKALGLTIPQSILVRADRVIE
jgi:putative ABC transport system substrate-binding protein